MKKFIILAVICVLGMIGCNSKCGNSITNGSGSSNESVTYEGPLSCISYYKPLWRVSLMDMTEAVHNEILFALNGGTWLDGVSKCKADFSFKTQNEEIQYHSKCGTFIDVTNERTMSLSESERIKINQLLK